jgi:CRISPR-associated protein Cas2
MSADRRRYLVCYDIADPKRLRRVATICEGWGLRLQESVFECLLDGLGREKLIARLADAINTAHDRVLLVDLGLEGEERDGRFKTLGLPMPVQSRVTVV